MPIILRDFTDVWDVFGKQNLKLDTIGGIANYSRKDSDEYNAEFNGQNVLLDAFGGLAEYTASLEKQHLETREYNPEFNDQTITLDSYE